MSSIPSDKGPGPGGGFQTFEMSDEDPEMEADILLEKSGGRKRHNDTDESQTAKKINPSVHNPSQSVQHLYTHPSLTEPKAYSATDKGPFLIHVSRNEDHPKAGTTIDPIQFGKLLCRSGLKNISRDGIKKVGRNRISVEFLHYEDANSFMKNPLLSSSKFSAKIPTYNITRMGVVRGVPTEWTMQEFVENVELPDGCGHILKVRRLNRKVVGDGAIVWSPTRTVVITFNGQCLPPRIFCCYTALPVDTYELPIIQCNNCCRFGHIQDQCKSKPRCYRCTKEHQGKDCTVMEAYATCLFCSGQHFANNKSCSEHARQKAIKITMSQDNVSYVEASSRYPPSRRSYADVARALFSPAPSPQDYQPQPYSQAMQGQSPKSPSPAIRSYKRTVNLPPRSHGPLAKGYDKEAHHSLIADYDMPSGSGNGTMLNSPRTPRSPQTPKTDNLMEILLALLINMLGKFDECSPPSNVAQQLGTLLNLINKIPDFTMECTQSPS